MSIASLIFFAIFAIPLVLALIWIMRQDKSKQKSYVGLIVLAVLVIVAVAVALYVGTNLNTAP